MTGKKSSVVRIHKRDSKKFIKDNRPISLNLFSVKFLKDLYLIPFSVILHKANYSLIVKLASFRVIHVLLSSCKLRMKSTKVLIVIRHTI